MSYVNGLHDAANQARKQAARAAADAQAAADEAARIAAKAQRKTAAVAADQQAALDPVGSALGFDIPRKLAGIPTWMLMAGSLMAVMFVFSGGKRR